MTRRRINLSIALMLLAIIAIVAFQLYWLSNNFRDEKKNLEFRTNVLFRESVFSLQAEKLGETKQIESGGNPKIFVIKMTGTRTDTIQEAVKKRDSINAGIVVVRKNMRYLKDSFSFSLPATPAFPAGLLPSDTSDHLFTRVIINMDSLLQDSITVQNISGKFAASLKEEKIDIPFTITKHQAEKVPTAVRTRRRMSESENTNKVTIGFNQPVTFTVDLQHTTAYALRKMQMQILVSFLLVGLTVLSFILLLRNLIQQRKLTSLKNDFISNITHELKTPIATVSVAIEALNNFNAIHDPKRTREYLDISANELQRLTLLVDKVLKLSMFEKQQIDLNEEAVDLKLLVEEVVSSMKLQFEKHNARIDVSLQGKDFAIRADRMHITSVIFNLLDNALKYSRLNPVVQIVLKESGNEVEMNITDNGIGISPEYRKKIFDKFFRVPTGNTHNVKGYGLGLSYAAYVIRRHRGSIDLESQPGIGSRFIIKLLKTA